MNAKQSELLYSNKIFTGHLLFGNIVYFCPLFHVVIKTNIKNII